MTSIAPLKAYHRAYLKALSIHRQWDYGDEAELLRLSSELIQTVSPLIDTVKPGWERSEQLRRHLKCVRKFLKDGEKESAKTDINDLVYVDLPSLLTELLLQAET